MWKVWVFWLAVFLRAAAAAPAGSEPASPLAGLCNRTTEPEYIVEHPEICQNFISCSFGRLINEWVCDEGKAWVRGHCDLPNPGECVGNRTFTLFDRYYIGGVDADNTTQEEGKSYQILVSDLETAGFQVTEPGVLCPLREGNFPVAGDCRRHVACHLGQPEAKECPPDKVFDIRWRSCLPPTETSRMECSSLSWAVPTCQDSLPDRKIHLPGDCGGYLSCWEGFPRRYHCFEGEAFEAHFEACMPRETVEGCNTERKQTWRTPETDELTNMTQ